MKILSTILFLMIAGHSFAIENRDLYEIVVQGSVTLPRGDEEAVRVNLQHPINFYSDKHDFIYVSSELVTLINLYPTQDDVGGDKKSRKLWDIFR